MNRIHLVYVTTPTSEEARKIARVLVEERLAGCANIIDGMHSVYHWEGKIESATESILILKTRSALVSSAIKRVEELHSNKIPAILTIETDDSSHAYRDWLINETRPKE